mmetsp:Transcript_5415/g.17501  ORF Transcript_5415/g.17501 Transcript_5415/m.17501 type:complete len:243 (+) Transcript_5415:1591-2319(+)
MWRTSARVRPLSVRNMRARRLGETSSHTQSGVTLSTHPTSTVPAVTSVAAEMTFGAFRDARCDGRHDNSSQRADRWLREPPPTRLDPLTSSAFTTLRTRAVTSCPACNVDSGSRASFAGGPTVDGPSSIIDRWMDPCTPLPRVTSTRTFAMRRTTTRTSSPTLTLSALATAPTSKAPWSLRAPSSPAGGSFAARGGAAMAGRATMARPATGSITRQSCSTVPMPKASCGFHDWQLSERSAAR